MYFVQERTVVQGTGAAKFVQAVGGGRDVSSVSWPRE